MTIRRQWFIGMVITAVIAVVINTFILATLTGRVFDDYITDTYQGHVDQLVKYCSQILSNDSYSEQQIAMELEAHLTDPIVKIKLYNPSGTLVAEAESDIMRTYGGMRMMQRAITPNLQEVDQIEINSNGINVGVLNITRYSDLESAAATQSFRFFLFRNSVLVLLVVIGVTFLLSARMSKRLARSLMDTVELSEKLDLGESVHVTFSKTYEIRKLQENLVGLHSKLKLKQKSRKQLIDEIVHQSRTPLTILKTHIEGYEDGIIDLNSDVLDVCLEQVESLTYLIEDVGHLIETEGSTEKINLEQIALPELIEQITRGLSLQFEKKGIKLTVEGVKKLSLTSDTYKLSQAIYNILTNAYKFTPEGGEVHVEYAMLDGVINICVSDNGIGIDEADQDKIFDAYYRSNPDRAVQGEGIGLYIALMNVRHLGGTISVRSKLNEGATFIIKLPSEQIVADVV